MMKWSKKRIKEALYDVAREKGGVYQAMCINYLEKIYSILSDRKMLRVIDFNKFVDGTFYKKLIPLKLKDYAAYIPKGETYLDFLKIVHNDFARGLFADEYKFEKPSGNYRTPAEAIREFGKSDSYFYKRVKEAQIKTVEIDGKRYYKKSDQKKLYKQ